MANPDRFLSRRTSESGLTLGEMLIVLVVFLILAAILWVSSRDVVVRTKHSRVLQEQRSLTRALASFEAETIHLPTEDEGLAELTRLRSFSEVLPEDAFARKDDPMRQGYQYYRNLSPKYRAVLVSVGPDGHSDVGTSITTARSAAKGESGLASGDFRFSYTFSSDEEARVFIQNLSYDPTNGTSSMGDIITIYQ